MNLLSNGEFTVMLNRDGTGFCRWRGLAVTRWREGSNGEPWGHFMLLRDEASGEVWSATTQPMGQQRPDDAVRFGPGRACFARRHFSLHSLLEVAVAPAADIELRRLTLSNHGDRIRTLSLTSYAELVLGPSGDDDAHPAFSKMFVQTEWDAPNGMLLATRRRRSESQAEIWAAQALQVEGQAAGTTQTHETDRARFLGRGRHLRDAQAMQPGAALPNSSGCVLDPVFSLRHEFSLPPGTSIRLLLWTRVAESEDGATALTEQLQDPAAGERLFTDAARHTESERRQLGIDAATLAQFDHWMGALLCSDSTQRATAAQRMRGAGGAPTLWSAGISGDRPIALLCVQNAAALTQVDGLLLAQRWWRGQQLAVDVVLLNQLAGSAGDLLQPLLEARASTQQAALKADDEAPRTELFCLREDSLEIGLRDGLFTVARLVLGAAAPDPAAPRMPALVRPAAIRASVSARARPAADALEFSHAYGGFCNHGRAYRIELDHARPTPAPWVNVIANPDFGFIVSAEGGGYTWSQNSQKNPLTPWPNDPVSDTPYEVIYLRDEENGDVWSATAAPIQVPDTRYTTTHGKGWSRFENDAHGIELALTQCVPITDTLKLSRLLLSNRSMRTRQLSVTGYLQWALDANGSTPGPFVTTSRDEASGAMFARHRWRADFGERVAFFDMAGAQHSLSGDRDELLGTAGSVTQPRALQLNTPLSGRVGIGLNPCAALQTRVELPPNTQIELLFLLGDAADEAAARMLIERYRSRPFDDVLAEVATQWNGLLDTLQVRTPDRAMDVLINDWLLYQVSACRLWARTAYYQASGAWGFRDQLQDVMALCVARPDLAREQLLRAAGRQFAEGDVQHWWLPPSGQGVRTKIRDDRVWLVYVAMHYIEVSGDQAVLDVMLPFLKSQSIPDGAADAFFTPEASNETVSLYEHAARAIDSSLTRGAHGLPLIGTGDWNDGMNAVGERGRGESSWLGWFLLSALGQFAPLAEQRGDAERAKRWRDYSDALREALEQAWDGAWYRRGYYDDGAALGSRLSTACRIDCIAQSWSVIAGTRHREHAATAMASAERLLVDHEHQLARLFTPPFDQDGKENPGYIKGYPPGVRENGGQYTHGATWSIFAWAGLGDGDRAGALFDLLNPIRHSDSNEAVSRYRVEPYVVSADVYTVAPHVGRGGWTWYTGSAAWLYRAGVEAVLGFHLQGQQLRIEPCIPRDWPGFQLSYRHRGQQHVTCYEIDVQNPDKVRTGVTAVEMDGHTLDANAAIALLDDGKLHRLRIVLG